MKLIQRIFALFVSLSFGLFIMSPLFALHAESQNTIILSSNFGDTCTSNIQCEVLIDGQYFCHSSNESISNQWGSIHHIPAGKSMDHSISYYWTSIIESSDSIREKRNTYIEPDPYIYPFVGIIKIQV